MVPKRVLEETALQFVRNPSPSFPGYIKRKTTHATKITDITTFRIHLNEEATTDDDDDDDDDSFDKRGLS